MNSTPLCIYHSNCADGFGAAWSVWKFFKGEVELYPGVYGEDPPTMDGRDVILVDFSYKADVLYRATRKATSVLVLDHHKSALEDLESVWSKAHRGERLEPSGWEHHITNAYQDRCEGIPVQIYCVFDMNRSGAGMSWDFFFPQSNRPKLIDHIEDRDLWRFQIPGTRQIQACLFSYPYDIAIWDTLMEESNFPTGLSGMEAEGQAIERKHHKDIAELLNICARPMVIGGHKVQVASLPYTLTSDAGAVMSKDAKFAACYWDTETHRIFSLRSEEGGTEALDVSVIAVMYGGGGHKHAAGFQVPRNHELAQA